MPDAAPLAVPLPLEPRQPAAWLSLCEVVLCSGFPSQLVLSVLLMAVGLASTSGDGLSFAFVVTLSVLDTAVVLALVVLFLRARGESVRDVLFGRVPLWGEVWRGVGLLPVVFAVVLVGGLVIQRIAPQLHNVAENPLQAMLDSPVRLAIFAVVVVVAGGLREEVQRGFILHRFRHDLGGAWVGLVVFSAAFGLGHVVQGYDAAILTGLLGLLWGLVFLARRSIAAPIVSHALFNLAELAIFHYASKAGLIGT
jgi:membrane protease YdiL (CAAX protease family)